MTNDRALPQNIKGKNFKREDAENTARSRSSLPGARNTERDQKRKKKQPKKITERYLHNAGLYYLERFAASSAQFRKVMMRKIDKSCYVHKDQSREECAAMLETIIEKFIGSELLNDQSYMQGMVNSLRRKGLSSNAITQKLIAKGLKRDEILATIEQHASEQHGTDTDTEISADLYAGYLYARKKRLGPFSTSMPVYSGQDQDAKEQRPEEQDDETLRKKKQRALAAMARAGYSYEISTKILETERDDAEDILAQHML